MSRADYQQLAVLHVRQMIGVRGGATHLPRRRAWLAARIPNPPPDRRTYALAKDAWGKGFATEALAAVIDVAGRIGVTRLLALCHPEHRPSRRVLEKCGFVREGAWTRQVEFPNLLPGVQQEAVCYTLALGSGENHAG